MIENVDYFVRVVDFPTCRCGGAVMLNDDGTYTVLINARLSREQNIASLAHEVNHMDHDDFHRAIPTAQKEREAV